MNFLRLGGVLAGAMLLAPVAASTANAAEISPASVSTPAFAGDDCYYSHWWNGSWHRHVRLVCDDGDDYYGGTYYNGGGFRGNHRGFDRGNRGGGSFNRGGGDRGGNRGGNVVGNTGGNRGAGTTGGGTTGAGNFRGSGGGHGR